MWHVFNKKGDTKKATQKRRLPADMLPKISSPLLKSICLNTYHAYTRGTEKHKVNTSLFLTSFDFFQKRL